MSQIVAKLGEEEVRYVLDDTEYVLADVKEDLTDLVYSDGTRTYLVNGHLLQEDSQTIVFQEGEALSQYYINNETDQLFVAEDESLASSNSLDVTEIIQLIDENSTEQSESEVVYISDDTGAFSQVDDSETYHIETLNELPGNQAKKLKLDTHVIDLDEFIRQQNSEETSDNQANPQSYQYAILKDGKFHIQTIKEEEAPSIDLSKITGKNLLTGQKVTLHNYIDNLQKNLSKPVMPKGKNSLEEKSEGDSLLGLLNTKIALGKTQNGKKLVGKIIHVEKKPETKPSETANTDSEKVEVAESIPKTKPVPVKNAVKRKMVSSEALEHVSKTLTGLMEMASVRKKLEGKNLVIKVIERKFNNSLNTFIKTISYSEGHMKLEYLLGEDGIVVDQWCYKSKPALESTRTPSTLTMVISEKNTERSIRVILDSLQPPSPCKICGKTFTRASQLKQHRAEHITSQPPAEVEAEKESGKIAAHRRAFKCPDCEKTFHSLLGLKRHSIFHKLEPQKCYPCGICPAKFSTEQVLKKHLLVHNLEREFPCTFCGHVTFSTKEYFSHLEKHKATNKFFFCQVCGRNFSRQSNLLRHKEIHKGGTVYECEICGCSYHYTSSLTRHIVQNHLNIGEGAAVIMNDK